MSADEEYLDNLLKSVTESESETEPETEPETVPEAESEFEAETELDAEPEIKLEEEELSFDIDAMLKELDLLDVDLSVPEETEPVQDETSGEEELFTIPDQIFVDDMSELSEDEIDMMLEASQDESSVVSVQSDEMETVDPDVDEINTLLAKADSNEAISDAVFDLFAGMGLTGPDEPEMEDVEAEEPLDIIAEMSGADTKKKQTDLKKAERDRKRQEKVAKKAAKKQAKAEEKEKKKKEKEETAQDEVSANTEIPETQFAIVDETDEIDLFGSDFSAADFQFDESPVMETPTVDMAEEETEVGGFEEVEEYTDIDDLLSSISMDDFSETEIPTKQSIEEEEEELPDEVELEEADQFIESKATSEKKEKTKKVKAKKEKEQRSGKSFWGKVLDFLTEEDEEEEEEKPKSKKPGKNEKQDINAENDAIMDELDKEDKKSKKSGKKGQKEEKKKKKKEKKPVSMAKKFKPFEEDKTEKRISKKSIFAVFLVAVSVFAVVFLADTVFSPLLAKQRAKDAYARQDYETCYIELSGWKLSEAEENMRDYSMVIMKMERRITAYEQFTGLRQKTDALDSLIRAVKNYDEIYQEALNCGAESEVESRYLTIIALLEEKYDLSEKDAKYIASLKSDVEYTRCLTKVIEGDFINNAENDGVLPGLLPEEEEMPDLKFSE